MSKSYDFNWYRLAGDTWLVFQTVNGYRQSVIPFPGSGLPPGHQKMHGLVSSFYSGYRDAPVAHGITGIGELVLVRYDGPTGKVYAFPVGMSGDAGFLGHEFKYFSGHHYPITGEVPTGQWFGNIPWPLGVP